MISYAITTHNEGEYIQTLLDQLFTTDNEIVIVDDFSTDDDTRHILDRAQKLGATVKQHALNNDFAQQKNYLTSLCTSKYILQVDADETLHSNLLLNLNELVTENAVDLLFVPRVNIVNGLTDADIRKWHWHVNELGWVQFPDYQGRIYRNHPSIQWQGKVHEQIAGAQMVAALPAEEEWALYHIKNIDRQRKQNEYYEGL
jgi:glycosyltransferase involved in cell wall biosynthesis